MNNIGNTLKTARAERGLSIRQVAHMTQSGESQISTWETGKVAPSVESLRRYVIAGLITATDALDVA